MLPGLSMDDRSFESAQSAPTESSSDTKGTSNGSRGTPDKAVGETIAARLTSIIEDSIQQQVILAKEKLKPLILDIKESSDEITERLQRSREQALLRKDELEADRRQIHQAACQVINAVNDTTQSGASPSVRFDK